MLNLVWFAMNNQFLSQNDSEKLNTNCFVSQIYFVASELRPTVVFNFVLNGPGVVIVVCSPGYRSSSIVVFNFVSIVICIVKISSFMNTKKNVFEL